MVILEEGVASGVNHKCIMKENLFEYTDRQEPLNLRVHCLRCAGPASSATLLTLYTLAVYFGLNLIHLIFTNPRMFQKQSL